MTIKISMLPTKPAVKPDIDKETKPKNRITSDIFILSFIGYFYKYKYLIKLTNILYETSYKPWIAAEIDKINIFNI